MTKAGSTIAERLHRRPMIPSISNENHYRTHLTNDDVRRMRVAYREGASTEALAQTYGTGMANEDQFTGNLGHWNFKDALSRHTDP